MKRDLILPVFEDGKDTPERRGIGKGQCTLAGRIYAVLAISVSRFHEAYAVFITLLRLFAGSQELADADCHPKRPPVPYYPASASHIIRPAINHYSTVLLT